MPWIFSSGHELKCVTVQNPLWTKAFSIPLNRGQRVCELWSHSHPPVAPGWYGPLPVQRLRTVPQDERPKQTSDQAQEETGMNPWEENKHNCLFNNKIPLNSCLCFRLSASEQVHCAPTVTQAQQHCGDAMPTGSLCVMPVDSTSNCTTWVIQPWAAAQLYVSPGVF